MAAEGSQTPASGLLPQTGVARYRHSHAMDELLAHAEAMLTCGPAFWARVGIQAHSHETLADAVRNLREIESCFCSAAADRLHTIVQREAIDREVWEFIARSRDRLKHFLGPNASEDWASLGFCSGPVQMPVTFAARLQTVRALAALFRASPERQSTAMGATTARASRLLVGADVVSARLNDCRKRLREQARLRTAAVARLKSVTREAIGELHTVLANKDPRWLVTRLSEASKPDAGGTPPAPNSRTHAASAPEPSVPRKAEPRQVRAVLPAGSQATRPTRALEIPLTGTNGPAESRTLGSADVPLLLFAPRLKASVQHSPKNQEELSPAPAPASLDCQNMKLAALLAWLLPPR